ncbi:MAG: hypothetical protein IKZ96_01565 [Bacilli bacterium]|nr:hypothetical protein [Bacilli bacterium]
MIKITREQYDEYLKYALKEEKMVDILARAHNKVKNKIPESISFRSYTVKHLLTRLRIIGKVDTDPIYLDYKDYETLERYKTYITLDDDSKSVKKK